MVLKSPKQPNGIPIALSAHANICAIGPQMPHHTTFPIPCCFDSGGVAIPDRLSGQISARTMRGSGTTLLDHFIGRQTTYEVFIQRSRGLNATTNDMGLSRVQMLLWMCFSISH